MAPRHRAPHWGQSVTDTGQGAGGSCGDVMMGKVTWGQVVKQKVGQVRGCPLISLSQMSRGKQQAIYLSSLCLSLCAQEFVLVFDCLSVCVSLCAHEFVPVFDCLSVCLSVYAHEFVPVFD